MKPPVLSFVALSCWLLTPEAGRAQVVTVPIQPNGLYLISNPFHRLDNRLSHVLAGVADQSTVYL